MSHLFRGVRLIDGVADAPLAEVDVVVESERIRSVLPRGTGGPVPEGVKVIDGRGKTLLPGLIDCHVHYTFDPAVADFSANIARSDLDVAASATKQARRALGAGVTSARSAGAQRNIDIWLRDAINAGQIPGPRLQAAGLAVGITGGHGHMFGIEADGEVEFVRAVRRQVRDGADVIKIIASEAAMLTTTGLRPGAAVFGRAEMREAEVRVVVEHAHRLERRVLAHAQGSAAVISAARGGVDSIEHAFLADEAAIECLAEHSATLVPTLVVTDVNRSMPGLSPVQRERQDLIERMHRASCERAISLGVTMATGTDTGEPGVTADLLWREIVLLHDHGASAMDAVKAATSNAAALLGIDDSTGTIEPGKLADLLLVSGDPMLDLATLAHPELVMQGGRVYRPEMVSDE